MLNQFNMQADLRSGDSDSRWTYPILDGLFHGGTGAGECTHLLFCLRALLPAAGWIAGRTAAGGRHNADVK